MSENTGTTRKECPNCKRKFRATQRLLDTTGGICRRCANNAEAVERECQDCGNSFKEYPAFLAKIGAYQGARTRCPTCYDMHHEKESVYVREKQECTDSFPIVRIGLDMENCLPSKVTHGSGRCPVVRKVVDKRYAKYDCRTRLMIYDYRLDGKRGFGSLAKVRVMRSVHAEGHRIERERVIDGQTQTVTEEFDPEFEYLVFEPLDGINVGKDPVAEFRLIGWDQEEDILSHNPHWHRRTTSQTSEGAKVDRSAGTDAVIVDDENTVEVRHGHRLWRYGLGERQLVSFEMRDDSKAIRLAMFVEDGQPADVEGLIESGWRSAKSVPGGLVVRLKRTESGLYEPPENFNGVVNIEAAECGGGSPDRGWACVVADEYGNQLSPFASKKPTSPRIANGTHAWFSAPKLATIQAGVDGAVEMITITKHEYRQLPACTLGDASSTVLFSGSSTELPQDLHMFKEAVDAGIQKAKCCDCRSLMFAN